MDTPEVATGAERALPGGRALEVRSVGDGAEEVVVRGADGTPELEIVVTAEGPVLRARNLKIEASEDLTLAGRRVRVEAEERIDLRTEGKVRIDADGPVQSVGRTQEVRARVGDVALVANDDVRAQGERVRLNC